MKNKNVKNNCSTFFIRSVSDALYYLTACILSSPTIEVNQKIRELSDSLNAIAKECLDKVLNENS